MDDTTLSTKIDFAAAVDVERMWRDQGFDSRSALLRLFILEGLERHATNLDTRQRAQRCLALEESDRILKEQERANKIAGNSSNALNAAFQSSDERLIRELVPQAREIVERGVCNPIIRDALARSIHLAEKLLLT